jgi:hypothetical protein
MRRNNRLNQLERPQKGLTLCSSLTPVVKMFYRIYRDKS